ncbi:MAG: hypothetical protein ACQCN6_06590 [Candidatus Bathyarchaeia archaeon]
MSKPNPRFDKVEKVLFTGQIISFVIFLLSIAQTFLTSHFIVPLYGPVFIFVGLAFALARASHKKQRERRIQLQREHPI